MLHEGYKWVPFRLKKQGPRKRVILGFWDKFKKAHILLMPQPWGNEQGKDSTWVPGIHSPGKERVEDS